jgi:hypothetical protein
MSKRPDQTHKDKLSTDYKQRTDDERINAEDKQNFQESRADSKIPEGGLNPALEDLQAKRAERLDGEE